MSKDTSMVYKEGVTPLAGVWIEMASVVRSRGSM